MTNPLHNERLLLLSILDLKSEIRVRHSSDSFGELLQRNCCEAFITLNNDSKTERTINAEGAKKVKCDRQQLDTD